MSRIPKCRRVKTPPRVISFKPCGRPLEELVEVYLTFEGLEAVRLADFEGLNQNDAAKRMNISRQTFGRILAQARNTLAQAVVMGYGLNIQAGAAGGPFLERSGGSDPLPGPGVEMGTDTDSGSGTLKEWALEKLAVSSEGPSLDDGVAPHFGRAQGFLVVDPKTMNAEFLDNGPARLMAHGAGINASEMVARAGARVVLTGSVGPKAFTVLQAAGILICQNIKEMTVREAVEHFKKGEVLPAAESMECGSGI